MKHLNTVIALSLKSVKLVKVFKAAKLLKPAISLLSMAIFAACYSAAMGWAFAGMLVLLLFLHELGHIIALKRQGHPLKAPLFIPFVGAVIFAPPFKSRDEEAYMAYGGPLLGTMAAFAAVMPFFFVTKHEHEIFWLTCGVLGFGLNLFNMLPISPLDGGRITQAVSKHYKWAGIVLLLALTIAMGEPGMLIVWIAVVTDLDKLTRSQKAHYGTIIWIAMAVMTALGVGEAHVANCVDTILGLLIVIPYWLIGYLRRKYPDQYKAEEQPELDARPEPSRKTRQKWRALFFGLVCLQVAALICFANILALHLPTK